MPRPPKWRCLECRPGTQVFGPAGAPMGTLDKAVLSFDEFEALRLLHLEHLGQEEVGRRLGVSRSTVSRMASRAHRTVTEALVHGKALCVEDGPVTVVCIDGGRQGHENDLSDSGGLMIVAVPHLQGSVNAHFGSTREFLIATVAGDKVEQTALYQIQGMQHNHAGIAGFLREQGVEVILAGGMGAPMQQALKQAGFEVYCGVSGPVVPAVEAFARGEIEQSEVACSHHQGEHHHAGHQGDGCHH